MHELGLELFDRPPYSPDLDPSGCFCSPGYNLFMESLENVQKGFSFIVKQKSKTF